MVYMNLGTTRLSRRPRNRWQDGVRDDGRIVGEEGWQEKLHNFLWAGKYGIYEFGNNKIES